MLALLAPVSVDFTTGMAANTALAGNGDGNFGKGKGNGGPNGRKPGKGKGGDDDPDDDSDDDSDDDIDPPAVPVTEGDGDRGSGPDDAANMAEADFAEAIDAAGAPVEGPLAGTPPTALPTISQLFSMGDEAAVSAENELELIANGWNSAN